MDIRTGGGPADRPESENREAGERRVKGRVLRRRDQMSEKCRHVGTSWAGFYWEPSDWGMTGSRWPGRKLGQDVRQEAVPTLCQEVAGHMVRCGWVGGRC